MENLNPLEIEKAVGELLSARGFDVYKIPESSERKSPDFELKDSNGYKYIIEVKVRSDDLKAEADRSDTLQKGEVFFQSTPVAFRNRIDGIASSAAKQMDSDVKTNHILKVLWVVAIGRNIEPKIDQFRATLYGTTRIWSLDSDEGHRECFYFRNSTFYSQRTSLDAAVVGDLKAAQLYLNTLSPRYEDIKHSKFAEMFGSGIVDPLELEASNYAYIVDSPIDRKDTFSILKYLEKKYAVSKLQNIDLSHISGTILVDK